MSESKTDLLTTAKNELVKQYFVYDAQDRMTSAYEVAAHAINGAPCNLTQYAYVGTSNMPVKMRESRAVWDSSWDL